MGLCTVREKNKTLIVVMPASIDHVCALSLEKEFREFVARQPKALLCDMSGTKYISSSALRIFLETAKAAKSTGTHFGLFSLTPFADHIISMSGFASLFAIYDTEDAAVRAFSRQ
jgi:anti-anti-sigma factor